MHKDGRMYICDRCGKEWFGEQEDGRLADFPPNWHYANQIEFDLLCDECWEEYVDTLRNFYSKEKVAKVAIEVNKEQLINTIQNTGLLCLSRSCCTCPYYDIDSMQDCGIKFQADELLKHFDIISKGEADGNQADT